VTLLRGKVVKGEGWGRKLGFPTANLSPKALKAKKLAHGIYAARIRVGRRSYEGIVIIGAPTFFGRRETKLEAYLFNFHGNLYGKIIEAEVVAKVRGMKMFTNTGLLLKQIAKDICDAKKILST
jgi:FAD synthase